MKKLKFGLALALLLGGFAAVGAVVAPSVNEVKRVEAAETEFYSYTFKSKAVTANGNVPLGNLTWNVQNSANNFQNFNSDKGQQFGTKASPAKTLTFTTTTNIDNVKKVVVNTSGASGTTAKLTVNVGGNTIGATKSLTTSAANYTFESDSVKTGSVQLSYTTTAAAIYVKSISIWVDNSVSVTNYSTTFYMNDGTDAIHHTSVTNEGESVAFPSTDPIRHGYDFDGWYDSSTGGNEVTSLVATGDSSLYAHWLEHSYHTVNFDAGLNGTCSTKVLTATKGEAIELPDVEPNDGFQFDGWYLDDELVGKAGDHFTPTGYCTLVAQYSRKQIEIIGQVNETLVFSSLGLANGADLTTYSLSNVAVSFGNNGGNNPAKYYDSGTNARVYSKNTITISALISGIVIEKIEFNLTSNYGFTSGGYSLSNGSISGSTWTGETNSLVITNTGSAQIRIVSMKIYYSSTTVSEKFNLSFDANGGSFVDADEWSPVEFEGERTVVLPIASDLKTTAYKYTTLVGWSNGVETYAPGASVTISMTTKFAAVYKAPELITIAQALEICELTGTTNTTYAFTVEGVVSELNDSGVSQYGNFDAMLTDSTGSIKIFRVKCDKTAFDLANGDTIRVTGALVNYQSDTPEFVAGTTYEFISRPTPVEPTLEEKLAEFTTNASVGFSYTKSGEDYTFSNVRLSFRGTISAELYDEVVAAGVTAAGIEVSIEGQEPYTIDCSANIGTDANGNKYVFGSLLVPEGKENIVVTGKAFVTVDGARLYLASTAHSLVSAVSAYLGDNAPALTAEQLEAVTALAASLGIAA